MMVTTITDNGQLDSDGSGANLPSLSAVQKGWHKMRKLIHKITEETICREDVTYEGEPVTYDGELVTYDTPLTPPRSYEIEHDLEDADTPAVGENEAKLLEYLNGEHPQSRTITEAHDATKLDRRTIRGHLGTLVAKELVSAQKNKNQTLYVITPKGRDYFAKYFS